jgi:F-type H+-transporting ATPase subunit b
MNLELGQILSQIVAFLIMVWVLKRFAWKPLLSLMEERKNRIQGEFDAIEEEKNQIENLKLTYAEKLKEIDALAKAKMQEEIDRGRQISQEIEEEAHREASVILEKARKGAEKEVADAKAELKDYIVNLTLTATEKIIEEGLDRDKYKKLIASRIEDMEI